MQTIELTLYTIDELPTEAAKRRAREWWTNGPFDFAWINENRESIKAFCEHFGAKLTEWEVGPHCPYHFATDATNANFRGLKVKDFREDYSPTGYCLDWALWSTFTLEFGRHGDAKAAFVEALHAGFRDWRAEMEGQLEDDYVDEFLSANGFTFTEDGKRFDA